MSAAVQPSQGPYQQNILHLAHSDRVRVRDGVWLRAILLLDFFTLQVNRHTHTHINMHVVLGQHHVRRSNFPAEWLEERQKVLCRDALNIDFSVLCSIMDVL